VSSCHPLGCGRSETGPRVSVADPCWGDDGDAVWLRRNLLLSMLLLLVLPLFINQNAKDRKMDAKMGCSDNGNAHTSIDIAADFRVIGVHPLLGEHGG
jgi:hypothetical protein